jgi:hypothetical protein
MTKRTIKMIAAGILAAAMTAMTAGTAAAQMTSVTPGGVRLLDGSHGVSNSGGGSSAQPRTVRPARKPAPANRPNRRVTPGNAFAVSGGQPKTIVEWYNMNHKARQSYTVQRLHSLDSSFQDLLQRRRHAWTCYQHGGGYAKDLANYNRYTQAARQLLINRKAIARNYHMQNIQNLRVVYGRISDVKIKRHILTQIVSNQAALRKLAGK